MVANRRLSSPRFGKPVETKSPPSMAKKFLLDLQRCAGNFAWDVTDDGMIIAILHDSLRLYTPLTAVCLAKHQQEVGLVEYYRASVILGLNDGEVELLHQCSTVVYKYTNIQVRDDILIAVGLATQRRSA